MTKSQRRAAMEQRLSYKPGYRFVLRYPEELTIESRVQIPCSDPAMSRPISDEWTNPDVEHDTTTERGAALASLEAALTCAIHEVLEWFSLDGMKLVSAHQHEVEHRVEGAAESLAAWCWRNRKKYPGGPRPTRAGDESCPTQPAATPSPSLMAASPSWSMPRTKPTTKAR